MGDEYPRLAYTLLHLEVGCVNHGQEVTMLVQQAKADLQAQVSYDSETYQHHLLDDILARFHQHSLSLMFPRSSSILHRAIQDAPAVSIEATADSIVRILDGQVNVSKSADHLHRCLMLAHTLLVRCKGDCVHPVFEQLCALSNSLSSSISDETMSVLLKCAMAVLDGGTEGDNGKSLELIAPFLKSVLLEGSARGTELSSQVNACTKKFPVAKEMLAACNATAQDPNPGTCEAEFVAQSQEDDSDEHGVAEVECDSMLEELD